jgi:hypothetical protein
MQNAKRYVNTDYGNGANPKGKYSIYKVLTGKRIYFLIVDISRISRLKL